MTNKPVPDGVDDDFEVIWHEPPPTGRWGPRLERFVAKLSANPNQWGELPPVNGEGYPVSVVTTLKRSYGSKGYEFKTTVFTAGDHNRVRIFGRALREDDPESAARRALQPVR